MSNSDTQPQLLSFCHRSVLRPGWCAQHDKPLYAGLDPYQRDVNDQDVLVVGCADGFSEQADEI